MKRNRGEDILLWWGRATRKVAKRKRSHKSEDQDFLDDEQESYQNSPVRSGSIQIELFLKPSAEFNYYLPLPYELMHKIFYHLVSSSEHPINELFKLCQTCEGWRQMVLHDPSLWQRLDLTGIPLTPRNSSILNRIYSKEFVGKGIIKEFILTGFVSDVTKTVLSFVESVMTSPKLEKLKITDLRSSASDKLNGVLMSSIKDCSSLESITVSGSKQLFNSQKWFTDFLSIHGDRLRNIDLSMSLNVIPPQLQKTIYQDCPNLKILDLTTCDSIITNSFDAIQLASSLQKLEVLRLGNVSFKRVLSPPDKYALSNLREISIPTGLRDADRDDALLATLAYGSISLRVIDIRGSTMSAHALVDIPSQQVEELHMDDICPITRQHYWLITKKWSKSLTRISLVKINCTMTIRSCLRALVNDQGISMIREIDLSSSEVNEADLRDFLKAAKHLESIDLTSCRSLPRGCKGVFKKNPIGRTNLKLKVLIDKLNDQ